MQPLNTQFSLPDGRMCKLSEFAEDAIDSVLAIEQRASLSPWSRQNFYDSVVSSHICCAVQLQKQIVAVAIISCAAGEAELLLLAVDPDFQQLGIAQGLLAGLQMFLCKRASEFFLEVRESNQRAINLYEKLGFNCIGRRPKYYPAVGRSTRREDALIYAKHLGTIDE